MRNIAMKLAYVGTKYHGWQSQRNGVTVQETLLRAVSRICSDVNHVTGCGRTDAGVHASVYCANFKTESAIPANRLTFAVNAYLPDDISVYDAADVEPDFNAILSCEKKEYVYKITNRSTRDPFLWNRALFYPGKLEISKMHEAADSFVGTHDFAAMRSVGTVTKTSVRTVYHLSVEQAGENITFSVCADGFLYNMARTIVGTLLYVSEGKIKPEMITQILESRDRKQAGPTAPAHGLYMNRLWYPGAAAVLFNNHE